MRYIIFILIFFYPINIFASSKELIKNKLNETDNISFKFTQKIGKKTGKDKKKGKATLISLLGYKNAVKYSSYLKNRIISSLSKYKSKDLIETVEFVVNRKK